MDISKYFQRYTLIPVVVKSKDTGKILNIGFMSRESLQKTIDTGYVWYCSRSSHKLWKKSSESAQRLVSIYADCDNDSLLIKVHQTGLACHKGKSSCFHKRIWSTEDK